MKSIKELIEETKNCDCGECNISLIKAQEYHEEQIKDTIHVSVAECALKLKDKEIEKLKRQIEEMRILPPMRADCISKADVKKAISELRNPYPKDIFIWDNLEALNFNRGRFNQHCFEIVENIKKDILKELGIEENSNV